MVDAAFNLTTLRALPIFSPLSDDELETIRPAVRVRVFSTGDTIMAEGEPAEDLAVLLVGEARVVRHHHELNEVVLGTVHRLDVVGEIGALTGLPRSATVVATEPCRLLTISRDALDAVLLAHPTTCMALLYDAYRRIATLNDEMETLRAGHQSMT